jgi:DNA-binding NarL/FixJ family response regulator
LKLTKQADIDEAMAVGAQGYLVKPVDNADLIAEVIKLIAEARIAYPVEIVVPWFRTTGFRLM